MARPLRIAYPWAWYHVMNRGLARNMIFLNYKHREMFLELLFEIHNRFQAEIHAYCLMGNHYHLLIRTPLGNISRIMRHLDGVYTQRINNLIKRDGPIFRGRYKAILVQADVYLLRLSRYIHLNPVQAGLVKKAEQFDWSSYRAYIFGQEPYWLCTKDTLNHFGDGWQRKKYKVFVEKGVDKEIDDFYAKIKNFPILGTEAFSKTITEKYLEERHKIYDIPEHKLLIVRDVISIDEIMNKVAVFYSTDGYALKSVKKKSGNLPRAIGIYLSHVIGQHGFSEIARIFTNTTASGVSRTCHRMRIVLGNNEKVKNDFEELKEKIMGVKSNVAT